MAVVGQRRQRVNDALQRPSSIRRSASSKRRARSIVRTARDGSGRGIERPNITPG
jgi:hypothetical protein